MVSSVESSVNLGRKPEVPHDCFKKILLLIDCARLGTYWLTDGSEKGSLYNFTHIISYELLVILFYREGGFAKYLYITALAVTNDLNGWSWALGDLIKGNQKTGI